MNGRNAFRLGDEGSESYYSADTSGVLELKPTKALKDKILEAANLLMNSGRNVSLTEKGMDKVITQLGPILKAGLQSDNSPEGVRLKEGIRKFNQPGGPIRALVIDGLTDSTKFINPELLIKMGSLGFGYLLHSSGLWKEPENCVLRKTGSTIGPVFNVTGHHDGYRDAEQPPHVDRYDTIQYAPKICALACVSNVQETPTSFFPADAILNALQSSIGKKFVNEGNEFILEQKHIDSLFENNFIIKMLGQRGEHSSDQFAIFSGGKNGVPLSINFDFDSRDFRFKPAAEKGFLALQEVFGQLYKPYRFQESVPANSNKSWQVALKPGQVIYWKNAGEGNVMHARPQVKEIQGAEERKLLRFLFKTDSNGKGAIRHC